MIYAWRLTHRRYHGQAMTGNGGLFMSGRWHSRGRRIVYCSSSLALATLELFVNLQDKSDLKSYAKTRIAIPEDIVLPLDGDAAAAFQADPDSFDSRVVGDRWLAEGRTCVLEVPSRIILEESNFLLDPAHPDFDRIQHETSPFVVDGRLVDADGDEAAR